MGDNVNDIEYFSPGGYGIEYHTLHLKYGEQFYQKNYEYKVMMYSERAETQIQIRKAISEIIRQFANNGRISKSDYKNFQKTVEKIKSKYESRRTNIESTFRKELMAIKNEFSKQSQKLIQSIEKNNRKRSAKQSPTQAALESLTNYDIDVNDEIPSLTNDQFLPSIQSTKYDAVKQQLQTGTQNTVLSNKLSKESALRVLLNMQKYEQLQKQEKAEKDREMLAKQLGKTVQPISSAASSAGSLLSSAAYTAYGAISSVFGGAKKISDTLYNYVYGTDTDTPVELDNDFVQFVQEKGLDQPDLFKAE